MREEKRITIDGNEYLIRQLGARQGRKLWLKLAKSCAAPLRELIAAERGDARLVVALAAFLENLDDATAEELYEAFGATTDVRNGDKWPKLEGPVFDEHFAGRYVAMTQWLAECVLFNFASFLGVGSIEQIGAALKAKVTTTSSASTSPKSATGSSGES